MTAGSTARAHQPHRRLRLGFLGLGWIGRQRLQALVDADLADEVVVSDVNGAAARDAVQHVPGARTARSFDELLAQDLDGVVIATPSGLHHDQTVAALEHGAAVFCQKPLACTAAEARHIVDLAKARNRLLHVDHGYQCLAATTAVRDLVRRGTLGQIFAVNAVFHNAYGPSTTWCLDRRLAGGGCGLDLGVHLVDLVLSVLGDPQVVHVTAKRFAGGHRLPPGDAALEDFMSARIDLATPATLSLECSWRLHQGRGCDLRLAFHGTKGGAAIVNVNGSFYDFRAEHYTEATTRVLASPPDAWPGRAAVAWATRLAADTSFDPCAERWVRVAAVLDQVNAS